MNKTLLLIIIDFLFLNLIALTQWEKLEVSRPPAPIGPSVAAEPAEGPTARDRDLLTAMQASLTDERATRESLAEKLAGTEAALAQRQQSVDLLQGEQTKLNLVLTATRATAEQMQARYAAASQDAAITKEQLARLQQELEAKRAEAERQQRAIAQLEQQQAAARDQIEGLTVSVKAAEQEKKLLQETADTFKQQAVAERLEREKVQATTVQLAQGVGQLAVQSGALTKEIRDNRPINANVLFDDFLKNRVVASFEAYRKTFLGPVTRQGDTHAIFVTDGNQVYALLHIANTPFSVRESGSDWERIKAEFSRPPNYHSMVDRIDFLALDPRVVALPVDPAQAVALGVKIYRTAQDPFKFPNAVLINADGSGYGEVGFKLDAAQPGYVQVDNRLMKRLFGTFAPSRGDLVFSQTGELLGIMVNSDYCAVVNSFLPARTIQTGDDIKAQQTGAILDALVARYNALPLKLQ